MTSIPDPAEASDLARTSPTKRFARFAIGAIGLAFCLGGAFGYYRAASEHGDWTHVDSAIFALFLAVAAGFVWLGYTGLRGLFDRSEPIGPRDLRTQRLIWGSVGLGIVLAIVMLVGGGADPDAVFSNSRLPTGVVAILVVGWLATLALSVVWHRTIDEHEEAAYNFGGMLSLYLYLTVTVLWWLLWRGGFAPQVDAMAILVAVTFVWLAGWMWQRGR